MLHAYYSDGHDLPLPPGHRFPQAKYRLLRRRVEVLAETMAVSLAPAPLATDAELLLVHTGDYVRRVRAGELSKQEQREIGFPWSPEFVTRALASTGATLAAARDAADRGGWGVHLAGGTHHAFADRGQGFCVFNDITVAVRALRREGRLERAMIVDCDVHQGNGTAAIFADDPHTFTLSLHGAKNFPLRKEVSDLDVPLPDGCDDARYLAVLDRALDAALGRFTPEWAFYLSGADAYEADRYGRMKLTRAGLRQRDERVLRRFRDAGTPVVAAMGGGYAPDEQAIADIHAATIEVLARLAPG
ncbi:Histone deacetylase-like amidohydrolase [Pirellulimonas nuda]|uniref:Histone deacetylase-like amidohydrolase n=1 Tax=Pirellulimonas nuda TaxID=2528009 RepID=A0A518DJH9_9BACT|nr:histone deacetylase [Pirellulimonas nuda]QDU91628.1 Histone deacetylase-like amidohydrolase [Pirellulimonas nuda]